MEPTTDQSSADTGQMMTERLRAVMLAAEQLPPNEQDHLADQIASLLPPTTPTTPAARLAAVDFSAFADIPDDAVDVLDRMRHEMPPTPPYEEP